MGRGPSGHSRYAATLLYRNVTVKKDRVEIAVPNNFSIINNTEEVLTFFHDINTYVKNGRKIRLVMKDIQAMTADAILYMLSQLHFHKHNSRNYNISGDCPNDPVAQSLFVNSGFYQYVKSQLPKGLPRDHNVLTIKTGDNVDPVTAGTVVQFARGKISSIDKKKSKSIYSTMIECMANTKEHAYWKQNGKWWLMAHYAQKSNRVHFSFLDNGLTIPNTIRKNLKDYVLNIAGKVLPITSTGDTSLIASALRGEFRSKTGYLYRGKGLPKIFQHSNTGKIDNLIVVSRNGIVNASNVQSGDMRNMFHGTLLCWDFV